MEFGIEKCAMVITRSGRRQTIEGIELPNQKRIRKRDGKKTYKYFGILEADTIKQAEMKEQISKEYPRRTKNLFKTNFCRKKFHQRDKHLGDPPCKMLGTILKMDEGRNLTSEPEKKKDDNDG